MALLPSFHPSTHPSLEYVSTSKAICVYFLEIHPGNSSTAPAFTLKPSSVPPSITVESWCVHGVGATLPQAGGGGCFMKSSYSHSWKTLALSPSATFLGEIISKPPIFTKIVVVTGSRCLLLCNQVCFNGSDFQMCSVGSGCLLGPPWTRGSSQLSLLCQRGQLPPWHMGLLLAHEHCSSLSFLVQL